MFTFHCGGITFGGFSDARLSPGSALEDDDGLFLRRVDLPRFDERPFSSFVPFPLVLAVAPSVLCDGLRDSLVVPSPVHCDSFDWRSARRTGFARKSSICAARHLDTSSRIAFAVMAQMGVRG